LVAIARDRFGISLILLTVRRVVQRIFAFSAGARWYRAGAIVQHRCAGIISPTAAYFTLALSILKRKFEGGLFVRRTFLAAVLAATTAIAIPTVARSAENETTQQAQAAPMAEDMGEEHGGGPAQWMRGEVGRGMQGWRGMMHRMMMRRNPQERCEERLAWRAAMRAYVEVKLNLTPEQRPLWDKVQSAAQAEGQKELQLCSELKPGSETTILDRLDRMQQFLSTRLEGLQAAKPAVQALYQALTPEQRAIFDHPFRL
jgi:hypothetical protein